MKGKTNNPNGRPKGSKNKSTKEIQNALKQIICGNLDTLERDILELTPSKRIDVIIKLCNITLPKPDVSHIEEDEKPVQVMVFGGKEIRF